MPITIYEYDSSGNLVYTESRTTPEELFLYDVNKNNIVRSNTTVDLNGNSYSFIAGSNSIIIGSGGDLSINQTAPYEKNIITDYEFNDNSAWTIVNTYPGTVSSSIAAGNVILNMDDTVAYNEWTITNNIDKYPQDYDVLTIDYSVEVDTVEGSSPQTVDLYINDKNNNYHLIASDVQGTTTYSGTITFTEQSLSAVYPKLKVYVTSPTNSSYKIYIASFSLVQKLPSIRVKNIESSDLFSTGTVSISPTSNLLGATVSSFGRVFVDSSDSGLYYRPAGSSTDYSLLGCGPTGAGTAEFVFEGTPASSSPASGKFKANSNSVGSITSIYVSENNSSAINVGAWLDVIDTNLTAGRPGIIQIINKIDCSTVGLYPLFGIFASSGYYQISLSSPLISNGTLVVGEKYLISYLFDGADAGGGGGATVSQAIALSIALG